MGRVGSARGWERGAYEYRMYTQALSGFNSISHMLKALERSYNRSFLGRGLIVISGITFDFENR